MRYDLIALDMDGTLLNPAGEISEANRAAVARAVDAGMRVVPCTGRGWREAHQLLAGLPGMELGIFVTGALITEIATGKSIDLAEIEPHLAHEIIETLADMPEAVLAYREFEQAGHDYLITGRGELTGNTAWWFDFTGAKVHENRNPSPEDLHYTVRVGMVAAGRRLPEISQVLEERFVGRVNAHHFPAVQSPDPDETLHVLEAFASGVDKWRGLRYVADHYSVPYDRVVAVGDQINDLSMLHGAGCSVAMGNAIPEAKAAAKHLTRSNAEDGVAYAIDQILAGAW